MSKALSAETSFSLKISYPEICTRVFLEEGLLQNTYWIDLLKNLANHFVIVTDSNVKDIVGIALAKKLNHHGLKTVLLSVPPGEKSKSRIWKEYLEDQMIQKKFGRDTAIIALGGGVINDLAGFVAATYCRGIPFVAIPTTLLAMVDACLGGKVGINIDEAKNWIGAYCHPHFIFIDIDMLDALPHCELLNGTAEIIKYALISSDTLFTNLQCNFLKWKHKDKSFFYDLILESCSLKKRVVEKDSQESGLRRILNFGHTVGHAIETISAYRIPHGEAIAIGMVAEAELSYRLGYLKKEEVSMIASLFNDYGFSIQFPLNIEIEKILEFVHVDKKAFAQLPRFVLLEHIGRPLSFSGNYCSPVDSKMLYEALCWIKNAKY